MKMNGVLIPLVGIVCACVSIYLFSPLFSCFDCFIVQKKTEISDNHVSGFSRHGGTLM